jgi:hypothetical protein
MENPDPGSGIRDKNHRSATLVKSKVKKTYSELLDYTVVHQLPPLKKYTTACETSNPKSLNLSPFTGSINPCTGLPETCLSNIMRNIVLAEESRKM